ncbi:four helix bundle protein [Rhizosphaericola mali]|uniref:Four helix bundle protein n=1 Tax=Rhizosphaericola mali TaxID=2545455 RepID=A0A5P2G7I7_9BACT|nr:four helix bundle protein [Rhizosphaericola mali]QES89173.1 four helix bundle protein [Rhizosphaericola mali]
MKSEIGLHDRTKKFHIAVIKLCETLPRNAASFEIAKQLIRSAGSVGANCRAMARAKSTKDFINKTAIVIEEADESHYWLEVLKEVLPINNNDTLDKLINEANELTAIFVSISKKSKY